MDPLHIFGFTVAHIVILVVGLGFLLPRALNVLIPAEKRRNDAGTTYAPQVTILGLSAGEEAAETASGTLEAPPSTDKAKK